MIGQERLVGGDDQPVASQRNRLVGPRKHRVMLPRTNLMDGTAVEGSPQPRTENHSAEYPLRVRRISWFQNWE